MAPSAHGFQPRGPAVEAGKPAAAQDPDSDRLSTAFETTDRHQPGLDIDTDGDGLQDGWEVKGHGSNPLAVDTDGDGVRDGCEVASLNGDYDRQPGRPGACSRRRSCGPAPPPSSPTSTSTRTA